MRALFYSTTVIAALSSVALIVLLLLPTWNPYVATVTIDFARVSATTHNFIPNVQSNEYQLRWEVIAYTIAGFVFLATIGIAVDHTRRHNETAEDYYDKYVWWLWFGIIVTTLIGSFIVAVMSGVMTITVIIMTTFAAMLAFALIGPIHNQFNDSNHRNLAVNWSVFGLGAIILLVYAMILLTYIIQASLWSHSVPWANWLILTGDLVIKFGMTLVTALSWIGARPIIMKRTFIILVTILALLHFLWIPWFFFARTVSFTP